MRKIGIIAVLSLILLAVAAVPVLAASPHFKGRSGTPLCTITGTGTNSTSTTCTATLAGLGNDDLLVRTSVSGTAVYQCQNQGGNTAPGQNRVLTGPATSDTAIPADAIDNGNLTFTTNPAVLTAAPTVGGTVAGCPNPNWQGVNPTLTTTTILLTIEQPPGTTIFTCTANNTNGLTSPVRLSCS